MLAADINASIRAGIVINHISTISLTLLVNYLAVCPETHSTLATDCRVLQALMLVMGGFPRTQIIEVCR